MKLGRRKLIKTRAHRGKRKPAVNGCVGKRRERVGGQIG